MHPQEPPRISLAQLPTPVVELKNLARDLGIDRLLLKRDDLTGLECSGNKIRKLEYVIADAMQQGATSLVTAGGFQSNHCRATAAAGARLGLPVRLLLRSADENPALDGNLFLDHLFGADISMHSPADFNSSRDALVSAAMDAERRAGRTPYWFPVGASVPFGCWGYIRCVHELIEQVGKETPIDLFVAVGSSGTLAGLILGKALFGCHAWRIVGVPICDSVEYFANEVRELIDATIAQFTLGLTHDQTPVDLLGGYIGDGYAIPYASEIETIRTIAKREGVLLEPTYTGKAFTAMLDAIRGQPHSRPRDADVSAHGRRVWFDGPAGSVSERLMSLRSPRLLLLAATLLSFSGTTTFAGDPPATAPSTQPEIRRGNEMGGTPEERANRFYAQLLKRVEPTGKGDIARLPAYLDFFHREFIEDPRLFATKISATADSETHLTLHGFTEYQEHANGLATLLQRLGFEVSDAVDRLPAKSLGDTPFGIVTADAAFIYDKPATPRENLTQCIKGDKVILLASAENGYFLCHGPDGYVGYIDGSALRRVTASEFDAPADWVPKDPARRRSDQSGDGVPRHEIRLGRHDERRHRLLRHRVSLV